MLVIFGLGNPGLKYEGTRHNAGVETLVKLAASYRKKLVRRCFSSYKSCIITSESGQKVKLVFPLTYMNSSGLAVAKTVSEGDRVLVICDQMDLPCGRIRLRAKGSNAGHNGLKSMMEALPEGFMRLYIGVGRPQEGVSVIDHVLDQLGGKSGVIRRLGASGRFDYSSRMVISLGQDLRPYEVDIPYQTAMILFEEELVNRLRRWDDISTAEALAYFRKAQYYRDPKMVHIIKQFLNEGDGQWCIINRNPTINEQGILYVKIRKIHETYNNYTLRIPVDILAGLGADLTKVTSLSRGRLWERSHTRIIL